MCNKYFLGYSFWICGLMRLELHTNICLTYTDTRTFLYSSSFTEMCIKIIVQLDFLFKWLLLMVKWCYPQCEEDRDTEPFLSSSMRPRCCSVLIAASLTLMSNFLIFCNLREALTKRKKKCVCLENSKIFNISYIKTSDVTIILLAIECVSVLLHTFCCQRGAQSAGYTGCWHHWVWRFLVHFVAQLRTPHLSRLCTFSALIHKYWCFAIKIIIT